MNEYSLEGKQVASTYNLIDHDQNPGLGMFGSLHVSEYRAAKSLIQACVEGAVEACRLDVDLLRMEDEDVGLGAFCNLVQMTQNGRLDSVVSGVDDQ